MSDVSKDTIEQIKEDILSALEQVIDPELGIDIVNLGLVYGIDLQNGGKCHVTMTLTSMGCPLADMIINNVKSELNKLSHVKEVTVELVWSPAWSTERMSRYARIALGVR